MALKECLKDKTESTAGANPSVHGRPRAVSSRLCSAVLRARDHPTHTHTLTPGSRTAPGFTAAAKEKFQQSSSSLI